MSQRGLLPKVEASAKGVSPMSDWRTPKGSKVKSQKVDYVGFLIFD
ncbi:hypothetical protein NSP_21570 [Nodularia spumigena CCY9414]|nr:hypothetical protein NSP_21570 [Nodularia spumigena CCY9414]